MQKAVVEESSTNRVSKQPEVRKAHRYECSNCWSEYSGQRYPIFINRVEYSEIISKNVPDGMLLVSIEDVDGHCCSLLKCYKNAKGQRYCIFGKHRLYEGFHGPVELVGVPYQLRDCITKCGGIIAD